MASLVCGSGVPQLIQGPGPGKLVGKRDNSAADTEQAVTGLRVGDIAHLVFRDIEQFRQLRPVCGGLVEKHQKLTVGEHEPGRLGAQALVG